MEWLTDPHAWLALLTLTSLEIVLGIDNIIFIAILVKRLPPEKREAGRRIGLGLAMLTRILLLFSLAWLASLTDPLFSVLDHPVSIRDLILIGGGLFLIAKSTLEIHQELEGVEEEGSTSGTARFGAVLWQIVILDVVFSLDSVITAIGLVDLLPIMVVAIVVSVLVMLVASKKISQFLNRHPTVQMLALSFLLLVGLALIGDGLGFHIPKGYIYFAMGFSVMVEALNIRLRKKRAEPIHLRKAYAEGPDNTSGL